MEFRNLWTVTDEPNEEKHQIVQKAEAKTKNDLTPRQWALYNLLYEHSNKTLSKLTHEDMLEKLDKQYDYSDEIFDYPFKPFNNLHSRRNLTKDLDAVIRSPNVHYVYVGGRFAVKQTEIDLYLRKEETRIKKEWVKLSIQKSKAAKDNQMKLQFNREKEVYEAYIRDSEVIIKELENKLNAEYENIN